MCSALTIPGLERLRLSSIEPLEVVPELIDLVAAHPRLARHFHIPLQSGSTRILRAMYRPYSAGYYRDLVSRIRERIPDAGIGADVMVGFPGETDDDFLETYELINLSPLTYLHVFPFSSRPGTVAAGLPNQVPDHVARFRAKGLRDLIARKNETFRSNMVGQELDVLTLEEGTGISSNFLRVSCPASLPANKWIRMAIQNLTQDGVQGTLPGSA